MTTRNTKCQHCGCHEFEKTQDRHPQTHEVRLLWRCVDCGAESPRVNGKQLAQRKSKLSFETSDYVRERGEHRPVVVEPQAHFVEVRLKGLRTKYAVSYAAIYGLAVRLAAQQARAEKKAAKKARTRERY